MKKEKVLLRKASFLRKWTAVFLSAALMIGMIRCAEPAEVWAAQAVTASTTWEGGTSVPAVTVTGGSASNPVVITVHGNVTVNGTITVSSGYVKFTGGGTLQWTSGYTNAIVVDSNANAVFENVTLDGKNQSFSKSACLFQGNVTLNAGTTIQYFSSKGASGPDAGNKGVIAVHEKGILNIYDGVTITGNSCDSGIIAIYQIDRSPISLVYSTAIVNMYGGTVTGNTVNNPNLGVIWNWCGNLNISGGTVTAAGSEYAVHTQGNHGKYTATTTISGGTITGDSTGAVCAGKDTNNQSAITITGGTFTGKIAATVNYGQIDVRGGKYTGSSYALRSNGSGTLTVHGGEFFGNTKAYDGNIVTQTQRVIVGDSADSVNNWDRSTNLNTYRYVAIGETAGAHVHQWAEAWNYDGGFHWHECESADCPETDPAKKDGYAEHVEDDGTVTAEPTEDAEGIITYTCRGCGYEMRTEPIEKLPPSHKHEWAESWTNNDTHHWHECDSADCDLTADAEKDGYAAHGYGEWEIDKEATETETGTKHRTCGECGYREEGTIPVKEHEHNYSSEWKTDSGSHWHECTGCGDQADKAAHGYGEWETDKEATETEAGTKHRTCGECGYREEGTIPVKEHEHSYSSEWKTDSGSHWHECTGCSDQADKAAHGYGEWEIDKEATETETGTKHRTCGECGYREEGTIPVKEHEHSYSSEWKTDSGSHWHECTGCGDQADKAAHGYGEWETDKEATETETGTKHRTCEKCGYVESDTIPATGGTGENPDDGGNTGGNGSGGGDSTGDNTGNTGNTGSSGNGTGENSGSTGSGTTENGNAGVAMNGSGNADGSAGAGLTAGGNITPEVVVKENVPATAFATAADELAGMLLTGQEQQLAQGGTDIRIILNVEDMSERVEEAEKALVESVLQDWRVGQYLDVSLFKLVGEQRTQITETAGKISVTFAIPDSLKQPAGTSGTGSADQTGNAGQADGAQPIAYAVLRVHDGQIELLPDLDSDADTVTIETDRFSTYVLILLDKETDGADAQSGEEAGAAGENDDGGNGDGSGAGGSQAKDEEPKTGAGDPPQLYATLAMIAGFTYLLFYFADRRRGMTEETKKELVSKLIAWAKRGRILRRYAALAAIFLLLVYYHSIGKKTAVEWTEVYGK